MPSLARLGQGLALLLVLGGLALWLNRTVLSQLSVAVPALILGLAAGTLRLPDSVRPGSEGTYSVWLQIGIVLLGTQLELGSLALVGWRGLLLVGLKIAIAFVAARYIASRLLPFGTARLLGIGNSVCGVTAILAAKKLLPVSEVEAAIAVGGVLAVGALSVLVAPLVALHIHPQPYLAGAIAGLAVDNTAESIATGAAFGPVGLQVATMFKLTRNALLGFVVTLAGKHPVERALWMQLRDFPPFIAGYLLLGVARMLGLIPYAAVHLAATASTVCFALAFVGVGMSFWRHLRSGDGRKVAVAAGYLLGTLVVTSAMVWIVHP